MCEDDFLGRFVRARFPAGPQKGKEADMDQQGTRRVVFARFPDVSSGRGSSSQKAVPVSSGRLLSQAASFKVLAVAVAVLVIIAIVPFAFNRSGSMPETQTVASPQPEWNPNPTAAPAPVEVAPATPAAPAPIAVAPVAAQPALVASRPTPVAAPAPTATPAPPVTPAPAETPTMSTWPNPSYPVPTLKTSEDQPQASANQTMALRPSEYSRNSYDSTRSGIH